MDLSSKLSFITLTEGVPNMIINKTLIFQTGGAAHLEEEPASRGMQADGTPGLETRREKKVKPENKVQPERENNFLTHT